jgi:hypothetical protein
VRGHDEARQGHPMVDSWMILAELASSGADALILEDGL